METRNDRQVQGLLEHAKQTKSETESKANRTIDLMIKAGNVDINFQTVSKASGISRTTLYKNNLIRQRIESLRVPDSVSKEEIEKTRKEIARLKKEIEILTRENQLMAEQLVMMDDIKRENERLMRIVQGNNYSG